MEHLIELVITALISGGVGVAAARKMRGKRAPVLDEYAAKMIVDENFELKQRVNLLERYNAEHLNGKSKLERENYELKVRNDIMSAFPVHIPLPICSVNWKQEYDYIDDLYAEIFLSQFSLTKDTALGMNLYDVWPREVADAFVKNNQRVLDNDLVLIEIERVSDALGKLNEWRIIKSKRKYPLGVVVLCIPLNGAFDNFLKRISYET